MSGPNVEDSKEALTNGRITGLEERIKIKFPPANRNWLLKFNGGHPIPSKFNFKHESGSYSDSSIAWFYAIYDGKYENFERQYLAFCVRSRRYPDHLVPIARDPGGNQILLAFGGPNEGKIYFWDHEEEPATPDYSNCHLIADSFEEFIDGLHDQVKSTRRARRTAYTCHE